jgi:hypothetical protein
MSPSANDVAVFKQLVAKLKLSGYEFFNATAYAEKYLLKNSEEKDAFDSPEAHYLNVGINRLYNPLGDKAPLFFDAEFYAAKYPALAGAGLTEYWQLAQHFAAYGVFEGRQGSAYTNDFDTARYLKDYPGVAAYANANLPAFNGSADNAAQAHYGIYGYREGFTAFYKNGVALTASGFPASAPIAYKDGVLDLDTNGGNTTLTAAAAPIVAPDSKALRLVGDADVRIDLTNPTNQVYGIDLNGNGTIKADGIENNVGGANVLKSSGFNLVDAYARNPLNEFNTNNNFLGDIRYDGASVKGDGVSTNGNIFLGGLGADIALAGVGNDFLAGGGVAASNAGRDELSGGRNADFFYAEFSRLQNADGNGTLFDGGVVADDNEAGNTQSKQDTDWLLLEVQDDEEPVTVRLEDRLADENNNGNFDDDGSITTRSKQSAGQLQDIENVDASGNLYGFLDNYKVELGGRRLDLRDKEGSANYGLGSSAQLNIIGSIADNRIIGGYDNDDIRGGAGNDLLFGGNMQFFKETVKDGVTAPNLDGIVNDGRDALYGDAGDDDIVIGFDGVGFGSSLGSVDGGANGPRGDTAYITNYSLDRVAATELESAAKILQPNKNKATAINIDLGYANYKGYRGGDSLGKYPEDGIEETTSGDNTPGTADQTQYAKGVLPTKLENFENVIATGMGAVDYLAAGANKPELKFTNQQNFFGTGVNLELRGTDTANTLYASSGNDILEGRNGNDRLSGGLGNDDFVFRLVVQNDPAGRADDVDTIERQVETKLGSNITDGTFGRDFGLDSSVKVGASQLLVDYKDTDLSSPDVLVTGFVVIIGGETFVVENSKALNAANNVTELAALIDAVFHAKDANVSAFAVGNKLFVVDLLGRDISDTVQEGYVNSVAVGNGAVSIEAKFGPATQELSQDRIIYKAYEDRAQNEGKDDDAVVGTDISLGLDNYAEDLVINFTKEANGLVTTRIAETQKYEIDFSQLASEDIVKVAVNGVEYTLQVNINLDGSKIGAETNSQFVVRLATFINGFNDEHTAAGAIDATSPFADTLRLVQRAYNGEETVFMSTPVVSITNLSGGQVPVTVVRNTSEHEVKILDFDGRDGALNVDNVLFVGEEFINRAVLQTATDAGGKTVLGKDAMVVYVQNNVNSDNITSATEAAGLGGKAIAFNKEVNKSTSFIENFAVHGDDLLLGGAGADTILGGTGDDRIIGSLGLDIVDGGKDLWVRNNRIEIYNEFDGTKAAAQPDTFTLAKLRQNEDGLALSDGFFDTLQFQQRDFGANARFTVTLSADTTRKDGGAGTVAIDANGDGVLDAGQVTTFTNFENIRTVSGTGKAVAGDKGGQGRDTLNVTALSDLTSGITYILTNGSGVGSAGEVYFNTGENFQHAPPVNPDVDAVGSFGLTEPGQPLNANDDLADDKMLIEVDGVENVIAGKGNDTLVIDENEAAKDNVFTAGLGQDAVIYEDSYLTTQEFPTFTFKVEGGGKDIDLVEQVGGRNGLTKATDTLISVESVKQGGGTIGVPVSSTEADVLDVTALATGAAVDFVRQKIFNAGGGEELQLFGGSEYENVIGSVGNDIVIVSDAMFNSREDASDLIAPADITFNTFLTFDFINDYKDFNKDGKADDKNGDAEIWDRQSIEELRQIKNGSPQDNIFSELEIPEVRNLNQFTFDMGAGNDTVDYSAETGTVAAVINFSANPVQRVMVDQTGGQVDFAGAGDRIDALKGVENIVAGQKNNIIDLTQSTVDVDVEFSANNIAVNIPELDREVRTVKLTPSGGGGNLGNINLLEYRDLTPLDPDPDAVDQPDAVWRRIEGSDHGEKVQFTDAETNFDHFAYLRGGYNEANYNELSAGGIDATITLQKFLTGIDPNVFSTGYSLASIKFNNGGVPIPDANDFIRSHTPDNLIAPGWLRIEASQTQFDSFAINNLNGEGTSYALGTGNTSTIFVSFKGEDALNSVVTLTGFETLKDSSSDDIYTIDNLLNVVANLTLVDNGVDDRDTLVITDKSVVANTINLGFFGVGLNDKLNFDFDVLDITQVTVGNLSVFGDGDAARDNVFNPVDGDADDLIVGKLSQISGGIAGFQDLWLTDASISDSGASYLLDTNNTELLKGNKELVFFADIKGINANLVTTTGVTLSVLGSAASRLVGSAQADMLTGGGGNDIIEGGKGKDVLDGGTAQESWTYTFWGNLGPAPVAEYSIEIDGGVLGVLEGGNIPAGSSASQVATIIADLINDNAALFNDNNPANGEFLDAKVFIENGDVQLQIKYVPGVDVVAPALIFQSVPDEVNPAQVSAGVNVNGGDGGIDTFVFRPGDSTKEEATADVINGFTPLDEIRLFQFNGILPYVALPANYVESGAAVANFAAALIAANTALAGLNSGGSQVSFQFDANNGYVFQDANGDNQVDQVVILVGVDNNDIDLANFNI